MNLWENKPQKFQKQVSTVPVKTSKSTNKKQLKFKLYALKCTS